MPVQTRLMAPLSPLTELSTHEEQFFPRLRKHVSQQKSEIGKLLPVISWHLSQKRPLAIHDFIMREGKDKVLRERVERTKRHFIVMMFSMNGIPRHETQCVMHPAHVPLESKPEAADVERSRNHGPRGGFFGNGLHIREVLVDLLIEAAQKSYRCEIFPTTVFVGNPLPRLARIIQVQHR